MFAIPVFAADSDSWSAVYTVKTTNTLDGTLYSTKTYTLSESQKGYEVTGSSTFPVAVSRIELNATVAGTYHLGFHCTGATVQGVSGASSWSFADNVCSILVNVTEPTTATISIGMTKCSNPVSLFAELTTDSGDDGGEEIDPSLPYWDMNGYHNGHRTLVLGNTVWKIYGQYIGELQYTVETETGTVPLNCFVAEMLANLAYSGWSWEWDDENQTIAFTTPDSTGGTWADMIYRTSVWAYYWNDKLWQNDVSGSWFGSVSSEFSRLNNSVYRILSVLANDEDAGIVEATEQQRQWIQDWYEEKSDDLNDNLDTVSGLESDFGEIFSGLDEQATINEAFRATDEGYGFWSQECYDQIYGGDASAYVFVDSSGAVPYSDDSVQTDVDEGLIIVDFYSEKWESMVNPFD